MLGRTTFVIAHRISTVKQADLVLVLEHGKITQMGTHEQLMNEEGHYRDIAVAQLRGDEETEEEARAEEISHMDRVQQAGVVEIAQQEAEKGEVTGEVLGK
jgi:ABC-type transport system involved in cytochrome bd biosynthesis fused ATPase/permease subunit